MLLLAKACSTGVWAWVNSQMCQYNAQILICLDRSPQNDVQEPIPRSRAGVSASAFRSAELSSAGTTPNK